MNDEIRSPEMVVLLGAILAAQWFSSTADGFLEACGNAVVWPMLVCGVALALLAWALAALAPRKGLWEVCREMRGFAVFPALGVLLFTLLAATALRDGLNVLNLFLLPETPRWFLVLLLLPLLVCMAALGIASVSRTLKLLAPVLGALYFIVLVLSVWNQADVYNFFPLLGKGVPALARTAVSGLSAAAWLPMLWIDRPRLARAAAVGGKGGLLGCALCMTGYVFYALLFPNGAAQGADFPLHRLSASGGFSSAFQRTHSLFIFVWMPVQMAAVGAGLCYAVCSLRAVIPAKNPRVLVPIPLLAALALSFPDIDHSPPALLYLLQTNVQALLALPLLIPLLAGRLREKRQERRARHA